MTQLNLNFTEAFGDELSARLDIPDEGEPRGYVLFAYCFPVTRIFWWRPPSL
jgi:hypothetical protein